MTLCFHLDFWGRFDGKMGVAATWVTCYLKIVLSQNRVLERVEVPACCAAHEKNPHALHGQ